MTRQEPVKLSVDSRGRQWWRLDCDACSGQYGCLEAPERPTAPYICRTCQPRRRGWQATRKDAPR